MPVLPSDLLRAAQNGLYPTTSVALDTETSGLHVDSGARVSTVSVAWMDDWDPEDYGENEDPLQWHRYLELEGNDRHQEQWPSGIVTWGEEVIDKNQSEYIVSMAWPFDQGVAGTGKKEDSGQGTLWADTENLPESEWVALLEWLQIIGPRVGIDMHHAKFDLHQMEAGTRLWQIGVDLEQWVGWDTQNGADIITGMKVPGDKPGTTTTSLKPTAQWLWGEAEGDEKKVISEYLRKNKLPSGRWDLMPWDIIGRYADQDARLTARLKLWQLAHLAEVEVPGWFDGCDGRMTGQQAIERRLRTSKMLRRVERRGLPFATPEALETADQIDRRVADLQKRLPFQPPTLPMAKHYWFGDGDKKGVTGLGRTPYGTTDKGAPVLDAQVVGWMVRDNLPGAETWRDVQKLTTANSRWYRGWAERAGTDGRLRTSIRQNGTVSGRFSVENIQLQAIPHDYRLSGFEVLNGLRTPRQLIGDGVPEGWEQWELDLAQAELRVAALFAGCQRMLDLIDAGADLHGDAAEQLFHVKPTDDDWDQIRNVAKRANFSLIFGVGWETLQADVEEQTGVKLTDSEAYRIVREWNALYPEFQKAIRETAQVVQARQRSPKFGPGLGWIALPNGERRWFKPGEDTHKAFNQRVQPNLAQFGLDWWMEIEEYLMAELGDSVPGVGGVGMVLMVHDSMVLLLPAGSRGEALAQHAVDRGVALWAERFPGVPGGVDAKRWTKKK